MSTRRQEVKQYEEEDAFEDNDAEPYVEEEEEVKPKMKPRPVGEEEGDVEILQRKVREKEAMLKQVKAKAEPIKDRFVPFAQPERVGILDVETNALIEGNAILAKILNEIVEMRKATGY
jgi:hypothetical protein